MQIQKVKGVFLGQRFSRVQRPGIYAPQIWSASTERKNETTDWPNQQSVDPWKGCDPEIEIVTNEPNPNFYPFNGVGIDDRSDYIRTFCENDARNRKSCSFACPNGVKMMFNGHTIPARKMKLKCRCPRVNGIKTCGWSYKRNLLTTGTDFY